MVANGVTVVVTTHFLDEAEYCDRAALIYRGQMIALGTPAQLKAQAVSTALPNPTFEDAFIALVEQNEAERAA
jgi:ABC-2 type transport system ATP-binding protein